MNHSSKPEDERSRPELLAELRQLKHQIVKMEQEQSDLRIMHDMVVQHADEIEIELQRRYNELQDRNNKISQLNQQLEAAQRELEHLVRIDPLTQLANRRYLDATLEREWLRLGRDRKPLSLLMADIDFFKPYNDSYGHPAGDQCLIEVAQVFLAAVRRSDDVVARYGGEEIAIVLPNTDEHGAIAVAQNLIALLAAKQIPHRASPVCDYVTVSIGISTLIPDLKSGVEMLLNQADTALYHTKMKTRNGFSVYQADTLSKTDLTQETEGDR